MANLEILQKLLQHKGPVWYVCESYVPGDEIVCPTCSGLGKCEITKSDCSYNNWTETVTCSSCSGKGRASKKFSIESHNNWYFRVGPRGIEQSWVLEEKEIFLSEAEAKSALAKLRRQARKKQG